MSWDEHTRQGSLDLVRQVGAWIQNERRHFETGQVETKSLNSLVSYVDRHAEDSLIQGLQTLVPESGFLGEEGGSQSWVDGGLNWIIDPLDGTTNFIHDLPPYAISLALMDGDSLRWGAVYELGQDQLYWAEKGLGAFCGTRRLTIAEGPAIDQGLVATGFPYHDFDSMESYLQVLRACFQGSRGVRRFGSAATDLAWVADGRFQAFFEHGLAPWDVAAGILLVREAGGHVGTFSGPAASDLDLVHSRQIVAGNPTAHTTLESWTKTSFSL